MNHSLRADLGVIFVGGISSVRVLDLDDVSNLIVEDVYLTAEINVKAIFLIVEDLNGFLIGEAVRVKG